MSLDWCFKADGLKVETIKKSISTWNPSKHMVNGHLGIVLWNKVMGLAGLPLGILYKLPKLQWEVLFLQKVTLKQTTGRLYKTEHRSAK